jgi:addiction module RelE/StbE family toxin
LIKHPNSARLGRVAGTRELAVHSNYILIYDVVGDIVRILNVLHTAREWLKSKNVKNIKKPFLID